MLHFSPQIGLLIILFIVFIIVRVVLSHKLMYAYASLNYYLSGLKFSFFQVIAGIYMIYLFFQKSINPFLITIGVFYILDGLRFTVKFGKIIFEKKYYVNMTANQYAYYKEQWDKCPNNQIRADFIKQLTPNDYISILGDYFFHENKYRLISLKTIILEEGIITGIADIPHQKGKIEFIILPSDFNGETIPLNNHYFKKQIIVNPCDSSNQECPEDSTIYYIGQKELETIFHKHFDDIINEQNKNQSI